MSLRRPTTGLRSRAMLLALVVSASLGVASTATASVQLDPISVDGVSTSPGTQTAGSIRTGKITPLKTITPPTSLVKVA